MRSQTQNIEDVYPLSPTQQGMLFHSLFAPASGVYIGQITYELHGNLEISALERSWQQAIDRHPILRTAFVSGLEKPIQVVGRHVKLPLLYHDWRGLSANQQQKQFEAFLQADRHRDFELSKAPLMRLNLMQLSDDTYQLILSHHHLILDGWSLPLLFGEVVACYKAFRLGQKLHLERPRPYRDYIAWLQQQDLSQAEKFWREYLKGFTAPTAFVVDRLPNSLDQNKSASTQQIQLSAAATATLQYLARQHRLTLSTIVQGIWALLLSRYSGEKDVVFGVTSSGRPANLAGSESMIGNSINTLPARVHVAPEESILTWLQQLQAQQLESRQYEYSPLMEIQAWSEVSPGLPLFESIVVFENYPMDASLQEQVGNLKIRKTHAILETNYPLTIAAGVLPEFYLNIVYDSDRFAAATITRMLGHLQAMLTSIIANPKQQLADLQLLTEAERHQLLVEWNHTQAEYPLDKCIHQLFEAQVEHTPDAIAVVFADQQLTYRELNARANKLAHHLQTLGVTSDVLVGICMERSLEMVVGMLGTLKAGGAYVPLEPTYPQERLVFTIEDARVSVLLTQERLVDLLPKRQAQIVCLDRDWEVIAQGGDRNPTSQVSSEHLAYAIYTSGSTGKPKGVAIPHRAICNHMLWMQAEFPLTDSDCVLQKTPFSFDASVWEFYAPLLAGGRLILAQPGGHQDSAYLLQLIAQQQVTILQLVPSQLRMLLEETIASCQSLRRVFCGGESLPFDLAERFFSCLPDVKLHNLYGPTEATIDTTFWICQPGDKQRIPIGRAIANAQIFLLDSYLQPVPIGVPGEIYIGGEGLARGYLNQPALTAEKFIPNPFKKAEVRSMKDETENPLHTSSFTLHPSERLYKTGDLARHRSDGTIEFLGRIDHQVKLRGFRIELGEIEAVLSQHPQVQQAVVTVREDDLSNKRLVAYVVPDAETQNSASIQNPKSKIQNPKSDELRSFLKQKLPEYMMPSVFLLLDALPLTPNGKVDRKSLPAPDTTRPELEEVFVAPRTTVEETLVQIWQQVLRVEKIGVYDNFFQLGGDSILSLQAIAKANQAGLQLTPKQLFEHQTIAELAAVSGTTTSFAAEQGIVTGSSSLTPIQYWFFEQALPDSHHWNQAVMLEVHQPCDRLLLEQIVQQLLAHHDALRLRFVQDTASWQAIHAAPDEATLSVVDLSSRSKSEQIQAIEETAAALQTSLNLSAGPLVRVALFELGAKQPNRLLIVIHHLVVDGVSWRILLEDLQTAYQQLSQGKTVQLPAKTTSYKQWAERLTEYAQSEKVRSQIDYWSSKSCQQSLPVDFPEGENTVASAHIISVALSQEETKSLIQDVPVAYQTQINDVLLTALVQAFRQWTGESSLLVDLEGHGREEIVENVDLSRTVGWFTTIFPVLLNLGEASNPEEALKTVKEQLRSIPDRGIGYGVLRYLSKELQALPQAEVKFNYLGQFDQVVSDSSLFRPAAESCGFTKSQRGSRDCLLEVNGIIVGGQLRFDWTYSKALHQQATIEKLAQGFVLALRSLIAHCQSPTAGGYTPSDFPQMQFSQTELDRLMTELGDAGS